ncbi:TPA: hypothetical protein DE059_04455 [Candidatus Peribacteria bacterium]|nr:hypothetical protein [Candidatus Peribacteria bacterium]
MLQRLRESLALVLITLLPFHALLVTLGTKLIRGSGNAPMSQLAAWKEGILAVILLVAFLEWVKSKKKWKFDEIDLSIVLLIALSLVVTAYTHGDWKLYLFGFKYDFVPLIAFFALRRVEWSEKFLKNVFSLIIGVGVVIAGYGLIAMFLPKGLFTLLGYSDLHSLYLPDAPLAAFQQIESVGVRRMQSVMSGPNQLGLWLLIPFSISVIRMFQGRVTGRWSLVTGLFGLGILLTFSRSAWIAALIIFVIILYQNQSKKAFKKSMTRIAGLIIVSVIVLTMVQPGVLLRLTSSSGHLTKPIEAWQTMNKHKFGLGLGMAGPASNRVSDACVHLPEGSDASWASDRPDLCVFVGENQVQPTDRKCKCPFLPENWYLQIGTELGIIGFALYLIMIFMVIRRLQRNNKIRSVFLAFIGISIAALFLHAWEDSAVAYTVWMLAAIIGI